MLDVLAFNDPTAWSSAPPFAGSWLEESKKNPEKLKIAYSLKGPIDAPVSTECEEALQKTIHLLKQLGHDVFEAVPNWAPFKERIGPDFLSVWFTGAAYTPELDWELVEDHNRGLKHLGHQQSSIDYMKAVMRLQVFSKAVVLLGNSICSV